MESAHQTEWLVRRFFVYGENFGERGKCTGYGTELVIEYRKQEEHDLHSRIGQKIRCPAADDLFRVSLGNQGKGHGTLLPCPFPDTIFTISIHRRLPDAPIMAQYTKNVNKLCLFHYY